MKQPLIEAGTKIFIIESNQLVTEEEMLRWSGELYTLCFGSNGGIKVKQSRMFLSYKAPETKLPSKNKPHRTYRYPHDYGS